MKEKLVHILRAWPLVLFLTYYVGTTGFFHTHDMDGKVIVHSHPFSAKADHQHTGNALLLIQQLSQFSATSPSFAFLFKMFAGLCVLLLSGCFQPVHPARYFHTLFCRPPPVLR